MMPPLTALVGVTAGFVVIGKIARVIVTNLCASSTLAAAANVSLPFGEWRPEDLERVCTQLRAFRSQSQR